IDGAFAHALRVTLRLHQDVLRSEAHPLGLGDSQKLAIDEEGVVRRTGFGRKLGDGVVSQRVGRRARRERRDRQPTGDESTINAGASCRTFGLVWRRWHGRSAARLCPTKGCDTWTS